MVLVGSRVLSEEHSQMKEPGLFLQTPLMQGLDSHSSMSETKTDLGHEWICKRWPQLLAIAIDSSSLDSKAGLDRFFPRLEGMSKITMEHISIVQNLVHDWIFVFRKSGANASVISQMLTQIAYLQYFLHLLNDGK